MNNLMRLERTRKQQNGRTTNGAGYALYGTHPDTGKRFDRWFPSIEKAQNFCNKKGWKMLRPVDMKALRKEANINARQV